MTLPRADEWDFADENPLMDISGYENAESDSEKEILAAKQQQLHADLALGAERKAHAETKAMLVQEQGAHARARQQLGSYMRLMSQLQAASEKEKVAALESKVIQLNDQIQRLNKKRKREEDNPKVEQDSKSLPVEAKEIMQRIVDISHCTRAELVEHLTYLDGKNLNAYQQLTRLIERFNHGALKDFHVEAWIRIHFHHYLLEELSAFPDCSYAKEALAISKNFSDTMCDRSSRDKIGSHPFLTELKKRDDLSGNMYDLLREYRECRRPSQRLKCRQKIMLLFVKEFIRERLNKALLLDQAAHVASESSNSSSSSGEEPAKKKLRTRSGSGFFAPASENVSSDVVSENVSGMALQQGR